MTIERPELPPGPTPRTLMTKIGAWELGRTLGRGAYASCVHIVLRADALAHVRLATHETGYMSACKILPALHGQKNGLAVTHDELVDAVEAHKELVLLKGLAGAGVPGIVGLEGVIPYQGWNFIFLTIYPHCASSIMKYPGAIIPFFRRLLISVLGIHELDISHEDLKRSNILATQQFHPILVDFGFAHFTPNGEAVKSLGGTMDYSSPEKLMDKEYDPFANDVWSLGIILLKLLGHHNPYGLKNHETSGDFKKKIMDIEVNWDFLGRKNNPGCIGEVIQGMLERDPKERWNIRYILDHPSMQTPYPDPAPFWIPSYHLPIHTRLTEEVILDIAFLAYNRKEFYLCQHLDIIVEHLLSPEPNWMKRWAGMLSLWRQREETFWIDVEDDIVEKTPKAKARAPRLSGVNVAKVSRDSLRPLREIQLSPKKINIPKATRPAPAPPSTPRKPVPPVGPPVPPRKSNGFGIKEESASTPVRQPMAPALHFPEASYQTPPRRTADSVFQAKSPKAVVRHDPIRTRARTRPMLDLTQLPVPTLTRDTALTRTKTETDLIDLHNEANTRPSSSATVVSTNAVKARQAPKYAPAEQANAKRPRVARDKENIPPFGESSNHLKPHQRTEARPLRATRRSPRLA